jgi:hypothetical protein
VNLIRWFCWRLRNPMPGNDKVAFVGAFMGWNLRVPVEADAKDFRCLGGNWRQAQWLAWVWHTALFEGTAALMTGIQPDILSRMGSGFYSATRRELQADFGPASSEEKDFGKAVDETVFAMDLGRGDLSLGSFIGVAGVWLTSRGLKGNDVGVTAPIAARAAAQMTSIGQAIRALAANPEGSPAP